ncbi:MAG: Flp family type IVb pilin [Rhodospirillales bacterium]|jgi:pilus assembly protein Flp/PilA|nr:Flp family type IVb pilin [Rhodospirillales bacterium]MDK9720659.1 Flp family type IVb pilin [Rhodospirillales bacterium]
MKRLLFSRFLAARRGATAMEYALIAAGISVSIVLVAYTIGDDLASLYTDIQTELLKPR